MTVAQSSSSGMIVWNDGAWGQPSVLTGATCLYRQAVTPPVFTVSCASVSSCVAVEGGGVGWSYDGAGWQPLPASAAGLGVEALACPSAGQCEGGGVFGTEGEDDGSGFGDPQVIWPNHFMVAISCASTAFCAAVDEAGDVALGTAVWPLVTLTVRIVADTSQDQAQDQVLSNRPMPECQAAWGLWCSRVPAPAPRPWSPTPPSPRCSPVRQRGPRRRRPGPRHPPEPPRRRRAPPRRPPAPRNADDRVDLPPAGTGHRPGHGRGARHRDALAAAHSPRSVAARP